MFNCLHELESLEVVTNAQCIELHFFEMQKKNMIQYKV